MHAPWKSSSNQGVPVKAFRSGRMKAEEAKRALRA